MIEDDPYTAQYTNPRKRKRTADQISVQDQQHQIWADALLDYFMLLESDDCFPAPPPPPPGINLDKAIDEKGHSAMHWAAAMGAIDVVKDLMSRNARIDCESNNLETPFMHSVLFTNNFDKQTMPKLARLLLPTVRKTDWFGSTVFHHIAATTSSKNKYLSARYYFDSVINVLLETWIPSEVTELLSKQDKNGDTALHIAAQNGARKCVRALLGRNVAVDIPNQQGVTADDLIRQLNERRRTHHYDASRIRDASSSPFAPDGRGPGVNGDSLVPASATTSAAVRLPDLQYRSHTAAAMMARAVPVILDKCRQFASALEADVEIKEQEALEAERVARKRGAEVDSLRRQAVDLGPLELKASDPGLAMSDEREEKELRALIEEAEALLEMESIEELRLLVDSSSQHRLTNGEPSFATGSENNVEQTSGNMGPPALTTNGVSGADVNVLTQKLAVAQRDRQRLVKDSVKSMSVAGLGEKQGDYKRLLRAALGVKDAEVEGMLNEVLKELEQEKEMAMLEEEG
jgi:ankyrin repeat protein